MSDLRRISARITLNVMLPVLVFGCSQGGSSSRSSATSAPTATVSGLTVTDIGDQRFRIDFTCSSDSEAALGVDVEYSEGQGTTFSETTIEVPGGTAESTRNPTAPDASSTTRSHFIAPIGGTGHGIVWFADDDLVDLVQHDLVIRVTPRDPTSNQPETGATPAIFGVGGNTVPDVTLVSTPSGTVGGWISFDITVTDEGSDLVGIKAQYSIDGGTTYHDALLVSGDGTASLATPPEGEEHTVFWDAREDAPDSSSNNVTLRVRSRDTEVAAFTSSGMFVIPPCAPTVDLLSLNGLQDAMNGSTTFRDTAGRDTAFTLLLPESGFVVWLETSTHVNGAALDPNGVELTSSGAPGGGSQSGGFAAGSDLGVLVVDDADNGISTLDITPDIAFAITPRTRSRGSLRRSPLTRSATLAAWSPAAVRHVVFSTGSTTRAFLVPARPLFISTRQATTSWP